MVEKQHLSSGSVVPRPTLSQAIVAAGTGLVPPGGTYVAASQLKPYYHITHNLSTLFFFATIFL